MIPGVIPNDRLEAVTRAAHEAFGATDIEDLYILQKGQSGALVFRIIVRGAPYLLRLITRNPDITLPDHFTCMKLAADAGLAPRIWHTSIEDRLSITDFVATAPLPMSDALVRMPATLRALHALPPFPERVDHLNTTCTFLLNKGAATDGLIQRIRTSNILPEVDTQYLIDVYEQIAAAYVRRESDKVSSHSDLFRPDNILFNGSRVLLVDWEAAFLNDRYADLAAVANMLVGTDDQERAFLQEYFGKPANEHQSARLFLMRQLAHIFYTMAFLFLGSAGQPIDWTDPVPDFNDLRQRIWTGEANMTDRPSKIIYGRAHRQQLLQNVSRARFNESLRIVSDQQ